MCSRRTSHLRQRLAEAGMERVMAAAEGLRRCLEESSSDQSGWRLGLLLWLLHYYPGTLQGTIAKLRPKGHRGQKLGLARAGPSASWLVFLFNTLCSA